MNRCAIIVNVLNNIVITVKNENKTSYT